MAEPCRVYQQAISLVANPCGPIRGARLVTVPTLQEHGSERRGPGAATKKHAAAVRGGAVFAIAIVIRSRETFPNGAARKGETLTARAIPAVGLGGGEARIGGAAAT